MRAWRPSPFSPGLPRTSIAVSFCIFWSASARTIPSSLSSFASRRSRKTSDKAVRAITHPASIMERDPVRPTSDQPLKEISIFSTWLCSFSTLRTSSCCMCKVEDITLAKFSSSLNHSASRQSAPNCMALLRIFTANGAVRSSRLSRSSSAMPSHMSINILRRRDSTWSSVCDAMLSDSRALMTSMPPETFVSRASMPVRGGKSTSRS
mmetsp:Transcript_82085/g.163473  ORF Transcript_82085/g.163473 Transcript_82085/m.163473 type:complete len:208 (+) Transcript_82085:603-1226(+)